jgi:hypothetical protein
MSFADDTAVVATDSSPAIALQKLQTDLLAIQNWFKKWRMKTNESKSIHVSPGPYSQIATPSEMMSSVLGYTLTGDLPGTNTFSQNGNN